MMLFRNDDRHTGRVRKNGEKCHVAIILPYHMSLRLTLGNLTKNTVHKKWLWSQPLNITWEDRCFLNVVQSQNVLRKTLQSQSPSAFWWNTVFMHHEVVLKLRGVEALVFDRLQLVVVFIHAHAAGNNLASKSDEVKGDGVGWVIGVMQSIERSLAGWIIRHDHKPTIVVLWSPFARKPFFCGGRKIRFVRL